DAPADPGIGNSCTADCGSGRRMEITCSVTAYAVCLCGAGPGGAPDTAYCDPNTPTSVFRSSAAVNCPPGNVGGDYTLLCHEGHAAGVCTGSLGECACL